MVSPPKVSPLPFQPHITGIPCRGARCLGVQLSAGERTLRLTAPPEVAADYAALRREHLEPHAAAVRVVLEEAFLELQGLA